MSVVELKNVKIDTSGRIYYHESDESADGNIDLSEEYAKLDLSNVKLPEDPAKSGDVLTLNADGTVSFSAMEESASRDLSNVKLPEDPAKKDYVLTLNADGTVSFQPQKEGGEGQSAVGIESKILALPKPILVNFSRIEQDPAELESKVLALPKPIFIQDYQTIENFY